MMSTDDRPLDPPSDDVYFHQSSSLVDYSLVDTKMSMQAEGVFSIKVHLCTRNLAFWYALAAKVES
jgi:hypothetical protein